MRHVINKMSSTVLGRVETLSVGGGMALFGIGAAVYVDLMRTERKGLLGACTVHTFALLAPSCSTFSCCIHSTKRLVLCHVAPNRTFPMHMHMPSIVQVWRVRSGCTQGYIFPRRGGCCGTGALGRTVRSHVTQHEVGCKAPS